MNTRRSFLRRTTFGAAAIAVAPGIPAHRDTTNADHPIKLGVASYSLRTLSRTDAIAAANALQSPYFCIKSFHLPYDASDNEFTAASDEFAAAGLTIVGGGNNNIREDTDEAVGMFFEYAKKAGMPLLVIAPTVDVMPRVEKFVKQFDIHVAIHNHGPEDEIFAAPSDALKVIKDMDPRVGLCIDVGHTTRTGKDVIQEIADAGDRVLDVHMKDLADLMDKDSQCIVGDGEMPIPEIFQQLKKMKFEGYANLEYEIDAQDPLPGMLRSFSYMRGVLAGLETKDMT